MEGRGIYIFNSAEASTSYFVGELKNNAFSGLGKVVFREETQYFGSVNNNQLQSVKAILKYGNGDRYKGGVQQNQKSGEGEYHFAQGSDSYVG